MSNRRTLFLVTAAIVAVLSAAAIFAVPAVSAARVLAGWEDDLRPSGRSFGSNSEYQFIDVSRVQKRASWRKRGEEKQSLYRPSNADVNVLRKNHLSLPQKNKQKKINWPVEELARWTVEEFNNRRLGPRVSERIFEEGEQERETPLEPQWQLFLPSQKKALRSRAWSLLSSDAVSC